MDTFAYYNTKSMKRNVPIPAFIECLLPWLNVQLNRPRSIQFYIIYYFYIKSVIVFACYNMDICRVSV